MGIKTYVLVQLYLAVFGEGIYTFHGALLSQAIGAYCTIFLQVLVP